MKWLIGLAAFLLLFSARPAVAQQPGGTPRGVEEEIEAVIRESGIVAALDSVAATATPELEDALSQLTVALSGLVSRIASDPQLRSSAAEAAQGVIGVARVVVEEQSKVLQDVLRRAADEVAAASTPPPARDPR